MKTTHVDRILNGINAAQAAAQAGVSLHDLVALLRAGIIFGVVIDNLWYISPEIVPRLPEIIRINSASRILNEAPGSTGREVPRI